MSAPGQRGSITVVAAGLIAMSVVLAMGAGDLARVLVASQRARTAADAAALAAAQELALPSGADPKTVAADYATRNGATLLSCACRLGATEATVAVAVDAGPLLLFPGGHAATATARAVVDPS